MSWGPADHAHDYADSRHDHDRYDVPAIRDLEDQISSVRNDSREAHVELWESIHEMVGELRREIADLRAQVADLTHPKAVSADA